MQENTHAINEVLSNQSQSKDVKQFSYFNRELSWIAFNFRVLEEALDLTVPILERLRFLSIFTSNLDEFFMIRVSALKQQVAAGIKTLSPDGLTPSAQLTAISAALRPLLNVHLKCLLEDIIPKLALEGIKLIPHRNLTKSQQRQLRDYFDREIFPILTPLVLDSGHPFPHISNLSINLGLEIADPDNIKDTRFARVKVPLNLPRLVPIPGRKSSFVLLEEIITAHIGKLFPGMLILNCNPFRITRDADIEIEEDEAEDLLKTIQQELLKRRFGKAVRLEASLGMPEHLRELLLKLLHLQHQDLYVFDGPLGISDFTLITKVHRPDLKYQQFTPIYPLRIEQETDLFKAIREGDILLHHPFYSFDPVIEFIKQAAEDPKVLAIKQTLYRTSGDSPIIKALIHAAENGKQVAVLLELKARFDEENNIQWARKLEEVGVHVVYGVVGLKTHCKIALVIRREDDGLRRYVHLGTGNYNPATASVYTDLGLFTCEKDFGSDASELFNFLTGLCKQQKHRKLLVAPYTLREKLTQLIQREQKIHRPDYPGHIIIKANALTDIELVDALYSAARSGVKIDLIIRGVCCLRPNVTNLSENIRVISVVGRFLEHSRLFYFQNGGTDELYLGSCDLMPRNMDRRVEILTPIDDPHLKHYVRDSIIAVYLRDNSRARLLKPDGTYTRLIPDDINNQKDSHKELLNMIEAVGVYRKVI